MTPIVIWIASYLIGSIPFGVIIAKISKIDIREHGSGNIGATNVARTLGKKLGLLTLIGDVGKGAAAVGIADQMLDKSNDVAIAGLMAFTGHLFSIFLKFKGGKGVATGLGIFVYLMPLATLSAAVVFALAMAITRYVSIGSMLAAISLPLFGTLFKITPAYIYAAVIVALLIVWKHKDNIQRLMGGTESKFLKK